MHHHPYILHLHHPVRVLIGLVLIITLMILGVRYWVLNTTESQTKELIELNKTHKLLKQDLKTVSEQQSALMKELDNTRHAYALLTETNRQLQAELADTHHTILQLNKELLFYQNVTQGNVGTELQARELRAQATPNNPKQYSYRIVLTQGKKSH
jgi:predicted negative regulator of RcsB-dependent stress response